MTNFGQKDNINYICMIIFVSLIEEEQYHLSLLLNFVKGPTFLNNTLCQWDVFNFTSKCNREMWASRTRYIHEDCLEEAYLYQMHNTL